MTYKNKKELKKFFKSLSILTLIFCGLIIQSFTPIFSQTVPSCNSSNIVCPFGSIPLCSNGIIGIPECRNLPGQGFVPGCITSSAFHAGNAICFSSTSSSSSSSSTTSSSSSSSSGGGLCSSFNSFCVGANRFCCNGATPSCNNGFFLCTPTLNGTVLECCVNGSCSNQNVVCGSLTSSSSSSGSSTTSSSSSSSGGLSNAPFCSSGQIMCNSGTPACTSGNIPICGSAFGFTGNLSGPGCTNQAMTFFDEGTAFCAPSSRIFSLHQTSCKKNNLCRKNRERIQFCREDSTTCKCTCQFKLKNQKHTPFCKYDLALCPKGLEPICTNSNNTPVCNNGILFCQDLELGTIDLSDFIICK